MKDSAKKTVLLVLVIELIAISLGVVDYLNNKKGIDMLERPKQEQLKKEYLLTAEVEDEQYPVDVSVLPQDRSLKEKQELIETAKKEIDNDIKGDNDSLDNVFLNLRLEDTYVDNKVKATWEFDNTEVIDSTGAIITKDLKVDTVVNVNCQLICDGYEEIYSFNIKVVSPDVTTEEGIIKQLENLLEKSSLEHTDSSVVELPKVVGGKEVLWKTKVGNRGLQLAILGLVAGIVSVLSEKYKEKEDIKKRNKKLDADYADIVSMLSLYVSAGISLKGSFVKIASDYEKKKQNTGEMRPGFEGIQEITRRISDGEGELSVYKSFGKRMNHKDYRKLSILISQNLRKGTSDLIKQFEKEEQRAFDEKKLRAKILGEEASTKLLLPMMGLLSVVLVVLICPAIIGMGA